MTSTLIAIALILAPFGAIVACLVVAERVQRRRDDRYAHQIELTDAIHRELGAITAPFVRKRRDGRWLVSMTVPLDRPDTVATILRVTDRFFASDPARDGARYEIVLTGRGAESGSASGSTRRSTFNRPARAAA
jgi:hypothetical protein